MTPQAADRRGLGGMRLVLSLFMSGLWSPTVSQADLGTVIHGIDRNGTGHDAMRIAAALNAASDGGTIFVEPGTYVWQANVAWPADKAITLSCAPGAVFVRDASYTSTFFRVSNRMTFVQGSWLKVQGNGGALNLEP